MNRYNKIVYWPYWADGSISHFVSARKIFPLTLSEHAQEKLDTVKTYSKRKEQILNYIESVDLDYKKVFEFYCESDVNENPSNITKICHRDSLDSDYDIILVISDDCRIVTIYINRANYVHPNLDHSLYDKKEA